jgi:fatty-acyl-CoA synthase
VTDSTFRPLLEGLDLPVGPSGVADVDHPEWTERLAPFAGRGAPHVEIDPHAPYLLIFTSGTTGHPKAAVVSQQRLAEVATLAGTGLGMAPGKVVYLAMPLFHSNALFAGWAPAVGGGATVALRRKFSASAFLPDVRRYGVTYFNYVGKPLNYVLATPERPDDTDNPLELVLGNEAAVHDIKRFADRFGCYVVDNYGSTEGGIAIVRTPETPDGALGLPRGDGVAILDPATGDECPPARFADDGALLNPAEAIGQIASQPASTTFEGYWRNEEADRERVHDGIYWSGDLGYRDQEGFFWFAGRTDDWLRVDGENIAAAPIERIIGRHPEVDLVAVYAVPNEQVGDDVMAAVLLRAGASFDPAGFRRFLDEQTDLHTKAAPRYVRVTTTLPQTPTNKVLKRVLRAERWEGPDPVWWRDDGAYRRLTDGDRADLRRRFTARERADLLT